MNRPRRRPPDDRTRRPRRPPARGFTLVELLVVIGIIGVLVAILLPALSAARRQARTTRELAAMKQAMTAYEMYTGENRGCVLPGYYNGGSVTNGQGVEVTFPSSARYPWRLAPYLNYNVLGTLVVNEQQANIGEHYAASPGHEYVVSLYPSFGINAAFVGGNYLSGKLVANDLSVKIFGQYFVRKATDAKNPAALIVFASARYKGDDGTQQGYFLVDPPYLTDRQWADKYKETDTSDKFGHVHLRHSGNRAACAFLDGHAELLDATELQDMRHWSPQATRADWTLGSK